ncbi:MAG: hypothetical protein ACXW11_00785 [Methylotenera sp.]
MEYRKIIKIHTLLICMLGFSTSTLYASSETIELPAACEEKLAGYSSERLATLDHNAEKSVSRLSEVKKLTASAANNGKKIPDTKIVYSSFLVEEKIFEHQECFIKVSVFVDDAEKRHLWHVFGVDLKGRAKFIMNPDGDFILLKQWRK